MDQSPLTSSPETSIAKPKGIRLRDLSPQQWKSGIAAWLGWLFDGLDMHLYTLVAAPFVAQLMNLSSPADPVVKEKSSWIQAAFLVGWALGGGFFGRLGDKLGRSRALSLTILTYAIFTGLSFFATSWWQLLIFRFLAALGIGGEWAVGATFAFGNLAEEMAAMDRRLFANRRQSRRAPGVRGSVCIGPTTGAIRFSRRRPACADGFLDPQKCS